jgi:hypothetical protein
MRRVGVRVSIAGALAIVLATSVSAAGPEPATPVPAQPQAAATPKETAAAPAAAEPDRDDYYTRRAKNVLEAEKALAATPHPLAARFPGKDIVVCEAGCPERRGPQVVFSRPKAVPAELTETRESRMEPTAGKEPAPGSASEPVCVAGCYDRTDIAYDTPDEPGDYWYPSTPPAPAAARDPLSPVR